MVSQKMSYIKWRLLKITLQAPFLKVQKTSVHISSGLVLHQMISSSLGHQCLMMSVHISSGLVLHQMTSDHNRSELGIQDHSNEQTSSKLVPKVVPLAVKTATSRQELELLFHLHIAMLKTTGGNMLPASTESTKTKMHYEFSEPKMSMLVKVIRSQDGIDDKDNDKGSKSRSQSMKEQAYNKEQRERPRPHELNDKSNLIDLMKESTCGFVVDSCGSMRTDKLYKFSDGTLTSVRNTLDQMLKNFRLGRIMRSLEKFVGGRDYGTDYRLLQWTLTKNHAVNICDAKLVHVPFDNETLTIREDRGKDRDDSRLNIISCTKTHKYILKGCQVFLAHMSEEKMEEKSKKKRLEDVPIVRDCSEVFPKDLHGLPPTRQDKFQIDLIPSAASVARSPYRLAPLEKHELSSQLQEPLDIRIYKTKFLILGSSGRSKPLKILVQWLSWGLPRWTSAHVGVGFAGGDGFGRVDEKNASRDDLRSNFLPLFIGECPSSVGRVGQAKGLSSILLTISSKGG
ncbi:hypothetical protein Tco_0834693 [Tanacetum coccineum]